jgi:hypothetical protein
MLQMVRNRRIVQRVAGRRIAERIKTGWKLRCHYVSQHIKEISGKKPERITTKKGQIFQINKISTGT